MAADDRDDDEELEDRWQHAAAVEAGRLDVALAACFPEITRSKASKLIEAGCVTVDGRPVGKVSEKVPAGAALGVRLPEPAPSTAVAQDLPIEIVYQDADVAVVDKAAGMVVHPGAGNWDGTLVNALLFHLEGLSGCNGELRPGIVHRLDRGTSGLLVVAKHDHAHARLAAQFAEHSAGRTYLALCMGEPKTTSGTIRSKLDRHPGDRLRFCSRTDGRGRPAVTHWSVVGYGRGISLIQCRLETGRTHQIRVHLTEQGWPLVGDPLYRRGDRNEPGWLRPLLPAQRPMLHAWQLRFAHPADGRPMTFVAPPPADFTAAVDACEIPRIWASSEES